MMIRLSWKTSAIMNSGTGNHLRTSLIILKGIIEQADQYSGRTKEYKEYISRIKPGYIFHSDGLTVSSSDRPVFFKKIRSLFFYR